LRTLEGHSGSVKAVAVTPDGKLAVSASYDNTLKVWDLESRVSVATFRCDAAALCCAFGGNDKIVAGDRGARLHFMVLQQRTKRAKQ
jgi:WD40 repeat protein